MILIKEADAIGYFGDIQDNLKKHDDYDQKKFVDLKNKIENTSGTKLKQIVFLKQTHSADVLILDQKIVPTDEMVLFSQTGDAIITNQYHIGIGVVTADCVPLFLIDPKNHAIGVIHAGWKGLHVRIISNTIEKMKNAFRTDPKSLLAYIGPSACQCCYEVQSDFFNYFPKKYFESRDQKYFFSSRQRAIDELIENKIVRSHINESHNHCTICSSGYCSVRRQTSNAGRQPSIIFLKK